MLKALFGFDARSPNSHPLSIYISICCLIICWKVWLGIDWIWASAKVNIDDDTKQIFWKISQTNIRENLSSWILNVLFWVAFSILIDSSIGSEKCLNLETRNNKRPGLPFTNWLVTRSEADLKVDKFCIIFQWSEKINEYSLSFIFHSLQLNFIFNQSRSRSSSI